MGVRFAEPSILNVGILASPVNVAVIGDAHFVAVSAFPTTAPV